MSKNELEKQETQRNGKQTFLCFLQNHYLVDGYVYYVVEDVNLSDTRYLLDTFILPDTFIVFIPRTTTKKSLHFYLSV